MFYIPVARPRQQIHGNAEGQHQQQITMPSPEVLPILPPPAVVEDPPPPGSRPWWLVHFLYLSLAILMAFLGDRYGFSPTSYYAPPPPQPQTQESGPPNEGMFFNPFNSVPAMDMNDHLRMEKNLKLYVYPGENGFKIPGEDDNVAYFLKNLYQSPCLTSDAHEAQLFFIPISLQKKQKSNESIDMIEQILNNPYWSRFGGADHFYINCGNSMMTASKSKVLSILGKKAIQLVCSSNHNSEFVPFKDILFPSTRHSIPREALTTQICRCDYGSPSTSCVADAIHSTCIPVPVRADAFHMVLYGLWRRRGGL
nr:putative glycosyltransferase [Quercus suber]